MSNKRSQAHLDSTLNSARNEAGPQANDKYPNPPARLQENSNLSWISPGYTFSPRLNRTVLKIPFIKTNHQSPISFLRDLNTPKEETASPLNHETLPERIVSPFPLQRFSPERRTSHSIIMLVQEKAQSTKNKDSKAVREDMRSQLPRVHASKDDIEAILANMKELSAIASPKKRNVNDGTCHSQEVLKSTLEEALEIPLDFLQDSKLQKRQSKLSLLTYMEKRYPLRVAYRRKSCCCTWCGGIKNLQKEVENNPWVSLLTGLNEQNNMIVKEIYKKKTKQPTFTNGKKGYLGSTNISPSSRKIILTLKNQISAGLGTSLKKIPLGKTIDDRNEAFKRPNAEKKETITNKLKSVLNIDSKLRFPNKADNPEEQRDKNYLNVVADSRLLDSNTNSLVFDKIEKDFKLSAKTGDSKQIGQLSSQTHQDIPLSNLWNTSDPNKSNKKNLPSLPHLEISNLKDFSSYADVSKRGLDSREGRVVESRITKEPSSGTRENAVTISVTQFRKTSDNQEEHKQSNGEQDMEKMFKRPQVLKPIQSPKGKPQINLKRILGSRSPIHNSEKATFHEFLNKTNHSKERELKKEVEEDKMFKPKKMRSIRKRNQDILKVYLSTSLRSFSNTRSSPIPDTTKLFEKKEPVLGNESLKTKKREKVNIKLKIKKVEEKNIRVLTERFPVRKINHDKDEKRIKTDAN